MRIRRGASRSRLDDSRDQEAVGCTSRRVLQGARGGRLGARVVRAQVVGSHRSRGGGSVSEVGVTQGSEGGDEALELGSEDFATIWREFEARECAEVIEQGIVDPVVGEHGGREVGGP